MNENNLNGQDENISPNTQSDNIQSNILNSNAADTNQANLSDSVTQPAFASSNAADSNQANVSDSVTQPNLINSNDQNVSDNGQLNTGDFNYGNINNNSLNVGINNDQISSLPTGNKKKNKSLLIILIIVILAICGVLGFIFVKNFILNSPERVFKSSIDNITYMINKNADNYNLNNKLYDISFNIDSNYDELQLLKNYTYGIKAGVDSKNSLLEAKIYMLDSSKKEYSFASYIKNDKMYEMFSSYNKLIDLGSIEGNDFKEIFKAIENYNSDDVKYIINKSSSLLKDNLNKKNFSKENVNIKVNGKDIKTVKNTYKADSKEIVRLSKAISDGLYNDDKSMEIITKMFGISKDEFKSTSEEVSLDDTTYLYSIYMNGDKFAGFDIVENNETSLSYYTDSENFDLDFGGITFNGVKNGKQTDVSIKSEDYEVAKLNVRQFNDDTIDFDYIISSYVDDYSGFENNTNLSGNVLYKRTVSGKKADSSLLLSVKNGKDYINFELKANGIEGAKISDIDESLAVKLSDDEFQNVLVDFISSLQNTPVGNIIAEYSMNSVESGEGLVF